MTAALFLCCVSSLRSWKTQCSFEEEFEGAPESLSGNYQHLVLFVVSKFDNKLLMLLLLCM